MGGELRSCVGGMSNMLRTNRITKLTEHLIYIDQVTPYIMRRGMGRVARYAVHTWSCDHPHPTPFPLAL